MIVINLNMTQCVLKIRPGHRMFLSEFQMNFRCANTNQGCYQSELLTMY